MTLVQTFCIAALICSGIRVTTLSSCESRANVAGTNGNWTFTDTNVVSNTARFFRMSTAGQ